MDRFVDLIKQIVAGVLGSYVFAKKMNLKLTSLDPLTFSTADMKLDIQGKSLLLPRFTQFKEADLGKFYPFLRNHDGQEYIFLGELRKGNEATTNEVRTIIIDGVPKIIEFID